MSDFRYEASFGLPEYNCTRTIPFVQKKLHKTDLQLSLQLVKEENFTNVLSTSPGRF